jgi:hypothetical protein
MGARVSAGPADPSPVPVAVPGDDDGGDAAHATASHGRRNLVPILMGGARRKQHATRESPSPLGAPTPGRRRD